MRCVSVPRLKVDAHLAAIHFAGLVLALEGANPPAKTHDVAPGQPAMTGEKAPAQERHSVRRAVDTALVFMHAEPQQTQGVAYLHKRIRKVLLLCMEDKEIVDVAAVCCRPEAARNEMVKAIKEHVREELGSLIAQRQPSPAFPRREQVITSKVRGSSGLASRDVPISPAHRKPLLLFRLVGSFLLRFDTRTFRGLLFQEPPRRASGANP
jgi:hypothetical protein